LKRENNEEMEKGEGNTANGRGEKVNCVFKTGELCSRKIDKTFLFRNEGFHIRESNASSRAGEE